MTDAEFNAWLKDDNAIRCVLVEATPTVNGVDTTIYMSNLGYVMGAAASGGVAAHTPYPSVVVGGCETDEEVSTSGGAILTVGDIEISNVNGEFDDWFTPAYIWRYRPVKMYVGDVRWAREDFRMVFNGVAKDIVPRDNKIINITLRDKLERLNMAISETTFGGTTAIADRIIPLAFGDCHNVEAVQEDRATLKHRVHLTIMERIVEVRDGGMPVSFTPNHATGSFTLPIQPFNQVTASIQGDAPGGVYNNTVSKIVQRIVQWFGKEPLNGGDLDAANLAAFDTAHPQPVGYDCVERENIRDVCDKLAESVGARVTMSTTGLLRLIKIDLPAPGPAPVVTATNMVKDSFNMIERVPLKPAVKLGYCKNWSVQKNLLTGIPIDHKEMHGQEWLTVTLKDDVLAAKYKITAEPVQENSYMVRKADALAECGRRLNLWSVQRHVFQYIGMPEVMMAELGTAQTIQHERYNLSAGANALVIGLRKNWLTFRVTVKVLI
jgi:hypothetical protein